MVQQVTNDRGQSIWTYTPPHTARRQWWSGHRKRTMENPIQELGEGDPQHPWSKATGKAHLAPFPGSLSDLILTSDNVPLGPPVALAQPSERGLLAHRPPRAQWKRELACPPGDCPAFFLGKIQFTLKLSRFLVCVFFPGRSKCSHHTPNPFLDIISKSDFSTCFFSFFVSPYLWPLPRGHLTQ